MNIFHKNTETQKQYVTIIAVKAGVFRTKKCIYIHIMMKGLQWMWNETTYFCLLAWIMRC